MRLVTLGVLTATLAGCGDGDGATTHADAGGFDSSAPDAGSEDARSDADVDAGAVWRTAAPCPVARFEAMGAVVGDELWVMGGFVSASLAVTRRVDVYDPATDTWRAGPDLPNAETHFGVAVDGRDVWIAGGFLGELASTTSEVLRWSDAERRWVSAPPLPAARAGSAVAMVGTRLHVAGGLAADGNTDTGVHFVLDLTDVAAGWHSRAELPTPRNHGGAAALGARLLVVGGRHGWDEVAGHEALVHAYDELTDTWTELAPLPGARSEIAGATDARATTVLVVGGSIEGMRPSPDVLVYEQATGAWRTLPPLPEARKGAVAARIGSMLVVTTGSPTSTDPSATTWITNAP